MQEAEVLAFLRNQTVLWKDVIRLRAEKARIEREAEQRLAQELAHISPALKEAEAQLAELKDTVIGHLQQLKASTGQSSFFDGAISLSLRSRPGTYDKQALLEWGRQYTETLSVPKDPAPVVDFLRETRPDLLVVDEKKALALATQLYDNKSRVFPEAPVEVEFYITDVSTDRFEKVLNTLSIEVDFTSAQGSEE